MARKIMVTPEQAREWLKRHEEQKPNPEERRAAVQKYVEQYAKDMREGRWMTNGSALVISSRGLIFDGLHRIAAVAEAGARQKARRYATQNA